MYVIINLMVLISRNPLFLGNVDVVKCYDKSAIIECNLQAFCTKVVQVIH